MKIAILIEGLNTPGGVRRCAVELFRILTMRGYDVKLLTREYLKLGALLKWLDKDIALKLVRNFIFIPRHPANLTVLRDFDLIINCKANEILSLAHIQWFHGLPILNSRRRTLNRALSIVRRELHSLYGKICKLALSNSRYVEQLLWKNLGIKSIVLHPPVESKKIFKITNFLRKHHNLNLQRNVAVTICRIERGRMLEVIPHLASRIKNIIFIIEGYVTDHIVLRRLHYLVKKYNLSNVVIVENPSRREILEILSRGSVYIHTTPNETFGISIVEAMAAGLIPLVHRSGGPWIDILGKRDGVYGFSYLDLDEAVEILNAITLMSYKERMDLITRLRARALQFDVEVFEERVARILSTLKLQ